MSLPDLPGGRMAWRLLMCALALAVVLALVIVALIDHMTL